MKFRESIRVPISNHLTGKVYQLVRANEVAGVSGNLARIVAICNEPEVYQWLFRAPLGGFPYTEERAQQFLGWALSGWLTGTHFVFAVIDRNESIVAACDIKTNDQTAEVGYWSSCEHRGVMTNAVKAMVELAAEAGFSRLFARIKKGNAKSKAVLLRAGFAEVQSDSDENDRCELTLNSP